MKKLLTLFAFTALLCLMPLSVWAQQTIVNVVEQTAQITRTSTLYVGEVVLDGQQSFYYMYSEDLTNTSTVFAAVRDYLSDFKDGAYSALIPSSVDETSFGITLCSNHSYESMMNSEWKSADKAGQACLPNTTVVSSSSENLYETNADFAELCSTILSDNGITLLDDAGETLTSTGIIGVLASTSTDYVTYTVVDGQLVKLVDRHINYSCELTTVIYTKVELASSSTGSVLGDVDGDGTVSVTDVAMIVNHILGVNDDNFIIANADIYGDGEIDINDVMGAVSIILEGDNKPQAYITCPDNNHPHMIDLGLPSCTKWACCNVGANKPEGYGGYYAWGETEEKSVYNEVTYQYCTGEDVDGDGWYDRNWEYQDLGSDIAGTQYDVAHVKWSGSWVMPSLNQIEELLDKCSYSWATMNGIEGGKFTGPSGGTIFLPAAGYRWGDDLECSGSHGNYWSSTHKPPIANAAYYLVVDSGEATCDDHHHPHGRTVRPVSK